MKRVESAELVRYNANSAGNRTGDCVKRAISTAFNRSYTEVSKDLRAKMSELSQTRWDIRPVYERVIRDYGGSSYIAVPDQITLNEFVDTKIPEGTFLVLTGNKNRSNHIVCVIDGEVYDTWDSLNQIVHGVYNVSSARSERTRSSIDIQDYSDEIVDVCYAVLDNLSHKYEWMKGYVVSGFIIKTDGKYSSHIKITLQLPENDYSKDPRRYILKFSIVFALDTEDQDAHKIIKATVKTRIYDRLYEINKQEAKLKETYELVKNSGDDYEPEYSSHDYQTKAEQRFYKSLPSWVRARLKDIWIDRPGQMYDSYRVTIRKFPNDTSKEVWINGQYRTFVGYTSEEIKQDLEEYYETFNQ